MPAVNLVAVCENLAALPSLTGTVALGLEGVPGGGETTWAIVQLEDGQAAGTQELVAAGRAPQANEAPELAELGVVLWISGKAKHWQQAADGEAQFFKLIQDQGLIVAGEVPYFIRHGREIATLIRAFAAALAASQS